MNPNDLMNEHGERPHGSATGELVQESLTRRYHEPAQAAAATAGAGR
ncbi:hypothetical protein [Streptomyces sp. NPDC085665]